MERTREIIAYLCGFCSINNKIDINVVGLVVDKGGRGVGDSHHLSTTTEYVLMYYVTPPVPHCTPIYPTIMASR